MTQEQIYALAREYADFINLSEVDKKNISAICECFLKHLRRRYCLVEKRKVKRAMALQIERSKGPRKVDMGWYFHKGMANAIKYFFPEITNEFKEMITETTYTPSDMHHGKCEWCGEESDEIVTTEDGEKCIGCIEEDKFYQETMRGI